MEPPEGAGAVVDGSAGLAVVGVGFLAVVGVVVFFLTVVVVVAFFFLTVVVVVAFFFAVDFVLAIAPWALPNVTNSPSATTTAAALRRTPMVSNGLPPGHLTI